MLQLKSQAAWTAAAVLAAGLLSPQLASAQAADAPSATELMRAAYEKTKTAKTTEDYTEVVRLCDQALESAQNEKGKDYLVKLSAWALNRRGKEYTAIAVGLSGDEAAVWDAKAMADFQEAVRRDPNKWQAVHNRGVSYAQQGEFEKATADFDRTVELNPAYPNAWFNRGEIRYAQGEYTEAVADYSRAIQLNGADAEAHRARAHSNYQLKRYRSALEDYNRAVLLAPKDAVPLADRADVYANLGYWDRAARDYRRAVELDNEFGRAYMGAAWLMATCPEEAYRDAKLALESAQKAIELDGEEDFRYLDTLAAAQANNGDYEQAKATIEKALAQAPEDQVERLKTRQERYDSSQPYRESPRVASRGQ